MKRFFNTAFFAGVSVILAACGTGETANELFLEHPEEFVTYTLKLEDCRFYAGRAEYVPGNARLEKGPSASIGKIDDAEALTVVMTGRTEVAYPEKHSAPVEIWLWIERNSATGAGYVEMKECTLLATIRFKGLDLLLADAGVGRVTVSAIEHGGEAWIVGLDAALGRIEGKDVGGFIAGRLKPVKKTNFTLKGTVLARDGYQLDLEADRR